MFHIRQIASILTISTLTALSVPTMTAAELPRTCETPRVLLAPQDHVRQTEGLVGEAHCYRLDLTSSGLLHLDVSIAGSLPSGATVEVFRSGADAVLSGAKSPASRTLGRSATERLSWSGAGTWFVEVRAEDPRRPLPAYRLGSRFLEISESETNGELEIEPEKNAVGRDRLATLLDLLCRAAGTDDHGDTLACATPFEHRAAGELGNGWGDDADVFRFRVRRWQTVEIATEGGADTRGTLFDAGGQRLGVSDDEGAGENFRLVRTLGPGTYFVRVEGAGSSGSYALAVHELGR